MRVLKLVPLMILATLLVSAAVAFSAEAILTGTVDNVTQAVDKNGATYTRVIVNIARELDGTSYTVALPVMGFGEMASPAAGLAAGDEFKAIVQSREYEGRESFTIIKLL